MEQGGLPARVGLENYQSGVQGIEAWDPSKMTSDFQGTLHMVGGSELGQQPFDQVKPSDPANRNFTGGM